MHRTVQYSAGMVACWMLFCLTAAGQNTKPLDEVLPNTTKGFVSATDMQTLEQQWDETQLGLLADDPMMKPFMDDLIDQLRKERSKDGIDWAFSWEEITSLARGEAAAAVLHTPGKRPVAAMLIDVTGNQQAAAATLDSIWKRLYNQRVTWKKEQVANRELMVFKLPRDPKDPQRPPEAAYFIKNNILGAISDGATARQIMQRLDGGGRDTLASVATYRKVMDRCQADAKDAGPEAPSARWYINPLEYSEARRSMDRNFLMSDKLDMLRVFKNSGFAGFQGVGGYVHLNNGGYDTLLRIAVYAPGPYQKSMRVFETPNNGPYPPYEWLSASLASYTSGSWNLRTAAENVESLYDQTVGNGDEGVWRDALRSIREDKDGPRVDLEKRLFPHLGGRLTRVSDVRQPVTTGSERQLFIAELTDAAAVESALEQFYAKDPLALRKDAGKFKYWEITPEEEDEPRESTRPANPALAGRGAPGKEPVEPSGLAVAFDTLMVGSHASLVKEILEGKDQKPLADDPQYQRVVQVIKSEAEKRNWGKTALWRFVRSDVAYMPTYELTRMGKLPESQSMIGSMLDLFMEPGTAGKPRKQLVDGRKLPDYGEVRHYLLPWGGVIVREDGRDFQGWFGLSFTVGKEGRGAERP
jgi:hypothetical protein